MCSLGLSRKFDTLFLSVKETDETNLTKSDHPLGWLLTVLQKEHANKEAISTALIEAMSHINTLDDAQSQQRHVGRYPIYFC